VGKAFHLVKVLMQRAAESDIELLESPADAQHWNACGFSRAHQRNGGRVAGFVERGATARRRAAIKARRHVGRRSGEEQTVDNRQDVLRIERRVQHRNQQRHGVGAIPDCVDIFLPDHVEGMVAKLLAIAGDADNGSAGKHSTMLERWKRARQGANPRCSHLWFFLNGLISSITKSRAGISATGCISLITMVVRAPWASTTSHCRSSRPAAPESAKFKVIAPIAGPVLSRAVMERTPWPCFTAEIRGSLERSTFSLSR